MAITLGVDVGRTSIKLVAVSGGRSPAVLWTAQLPRDGVAEPGLSDLARRARALAKGPFDTVVTAVSSESASLLLFPMPFSNPKIIEKTMAGEVEGLVPGSIEEHQLALQIVSSSKQGAQVAVGVVPVAALHEIIDGLSPAGLEPRIVDLDVLALWTVAAALGAGAAPRAIVDVGASTTRLLVLTGDRVRAIRIIPGGGGAMTAALETRHGLDAAMADAAKIELADRFGVDPGGEPAASADEAARLATVRDAYAALADDIAVSIRAIEHKERIEVDRVWLVGGAARARGFDRLVRERSGIESEIAKPPEGANADPSWWPEGAVAFGLALRGSRTAGGSSLNFRHGPFAYGRDVREVTRRVAPLAIPIAAILISGLVSFSVRYASLSSQATEIRAQVLDAFRAEFGNVPIQDPEAQIRQQIKALDKKIAGLAAPAPPAEVLRVLSTVAPADLDVTLDTVTVEGGRATFIGRADRFETIERLKTALSGTDPFGDVRIQDQSKDGAQVKFTMVADLAHESEEAS